MKENSTKFWKSNKFIILILVVFPALIFLCLLYLVYGNLWEALVKMYKLRGKPQETADAVASLSDLWTFLLTVYSIGITGYFSYLVWKINKRSLYISEELENLEKNRDFEDRRKRALIVYYDLQRGLTYIRELYISLIIKEEKPKLNRIFFSENWIENVAALRSNLENDDISKLYKIYNDFYTIKNLLEVDKDIDDVKGEELRKFIDDLSNQIFSDFPPLQLMDRFSLLSTEDLVDIDIFILLHKIYRLTFSNKDIEFVDGNKYLIDGTNHYCFISGDLYNGEAILYTTNGWEKARGYISDGVFKSGNVSGYLSSNKRIYFINYETVNSIREKNELELKNPNNEDEYFYKGIFYNGAITDGITLKFYKDGKMKYWGEVKDGYKSGIGKTFDSNGELFFEGKYETNERIKGKLYKNGRVRFEGTFVNGKPWDGYVNKYDFPNEYVKAFTGEIKEGIPYKGEGLLFKSGDGIDSLEELLVRDAYYEDQIDQMSEEQERDYEEDERAFENQQIRDEYYGWEEYIKTDWKNGISQERTNVERNKILYYNPNLVRTTQDQ
ncbi:toxin-antitoxin system YwqK family antitoxin [Niallia sp. Krafla_26]|uniref:toxin-antitoxin system YwqK family antitoxin n=1 Tax=Niallia sp. Krafla_26 TaxID=3064703 RepID=UPI003D182267